MVFQVFVFVLCFRNREGANDSVICKSQIVTLAQEWIAANVIPPVEVIGSLALQMNQRAIDEERVSALLSHIKLP
jgi:hypothetical protein